MSATTPDDSNAEYRLVVSLPAAVPAVATKYLVVAAQRVAAAAETPAFAVFVVVVAAQRGVLANEVPMAVAATLALQIAKVLKMRKPCAYVFWLMFSTIPPAGCC